jgi:hypothetical protein
MGGRLGGPCLAKRATITKKPFRASRLSASRLCFSEATLRIEVQGSVVNSVSQTWTTAVDEQPTKSGQCREACSGQPCYRGE